MTETTIRIHETPEALALAAAEIFVREAAEAVREKGRFSVALAGGSTPRLLYSILAGDRDPFLPERIPWSWIHFFWGDERHVPPDHPDSNYRMARETLLSRVPAPAEKIHRIPTEEKDPERTAALYEGSLRRSFSVEPGTLPRFDLILLGMGADGHTASLFPGSPELEERVRLVTAVHVPELETRRITLTLPVLNAAAHALFLVSGPEKAATLRAALQGGSGGDALPAGRVRPPDGRLTWLADRAAAAEIRSHA